MLLPSIKLTMLRLLRKLVLHYAKGDHRILSLLVTLLLTIATFISATPWVRLVLESGLEGTTKRNIGGVERIPFPTEDLRHISSSNNSLTTKSIEKSGLQCKIVPYNASIKINMKGYKKKLNQAFLSTGNIRCKGSKFYWFHESQVVPKIIHNGIKVLNTHVFLFKGSLCDIVVQN